MVKFHNMKPPYPAFSGTPIRKKIVKILSLVIVAFFLFLSAGFCNDTDMAEDGSHCPVCCSAGCHASIVQNNQFTILYYPSASFIPIDTTLRQELFISGIDYPPKSLI